jgi:hypothetical protein
MYEHNGDRYYIIDGHIHDWTEGCWTRATAATGPCT